MNTQFVKRISLALSLTAVVLVASPPAKADTYKQIEWIELMPKDDLDALLNPPDYLYQFY